MTAAGRVALTRHSLRRPRCGPAAYPLDTRVGLEGFPSPQAPRLSCLAAASRSFEVTSDAPDGSVLDVCEDAVEEKGTR